MLRIRDVYLRSRILIFTHPRSRISAIFQRIIEHSTQKIVTKLSKIWVWDPGSEIQKKNYSGSWVPDPGVKKAPDPGSGSATLFVNLGQFPYPGSGSAFPIRIRIHDSQMNADPCGSGSTTLTLTFMKSHNKIIEIFILKISFKLKGFGLKRKPAVLQSIESNAI